MVLDRLRRHTRDGRWIPEVDGLRFLAIAQVLLFHAAGEFLTRPDHTLLRIPARYHFFFFRLNGHGDRGVRLFFVLSGFILALPFARHFLLSQSRPSLRSFYLRRLTRLEPPFLLSLLLIAAAELLTRRAPPHFLAHFAATALYLHGLVFHGISRISFITWSLEVEVQFYLLVPLLAQLFRIRPALPRRLVLLAIIAAAGAFQVHFLWNTFAVITLAFYIQYFLAGLLLADVFILDADRIPSGFLWDAFSLLGWAYVFTSAPRPQTTHILLPFLLPLLCLAALKGRMVRAFFAHPAIALTGGTCYSIYLLHIPLLSAFFHLTRNLVPTTDPLVYFLAQCAFVLPPLLLCTTAFYLLIERPCMNPHWPTRLLTAFTRKPRRDPPAPA